MRTKNAGLFGVVVCSLLFLCSCLGNPTLDTTSSASYKQSLQKIYETQKDEQTRLLLTNAISSVATEGKEGDLDDSSVSYDFYDILSAHGGAGRLMPLNGKNADEIIAMGYEARKKWVTVNIPQKIESVQQEIAKLNEKKLLTGKITNTEKVFQLSDVTLSPKQALEAVSNKPLNGVSKFIVMGKGINKGSVPVYGCDVVVTVTDSKNNFVHYDAQRITIQFPAPIEPSSVQEFHKELSVWDWSTTPYEMDRYILKYTLKSVNASSKGTGLLDAGFFSGSTKLSSYDETKLANLEKELVGLTALLKQFSN